MNIHARAFAFLAILAMTGCSTTPQPSAMKTAASLSPANPNEHIEGFTNTSMLPGGIWHQHDPNRPQPPVVTPGTTLIQSSKKSWFWELLPPLITPKTTFSGIVLPPSDAEVLFDGKDLSKWQNSRGEAATWKVQDGYMEVSLPKGNDIRTKGKWSDFQLHVEWSAPTKTAGLHGQSRGNSGILINNMYEVQVLDSYQDKTYPDGQAGALYGQMPPLVNASKPPGEWQTYDIIWESPRWNDKGELIQKAAVTVIFNGVVVQHHTEYIGSTDGIGGGVAYRAQSFYKQHDPAVYIQLQNHNSNPVRYRNIWIRDLNIAERQ